MTVTDLLGPLGQGSDRRGAWPTCGVPLFRPRWPVRRMAPHSSPLSHFGPRRRLSENIATVSSASSNLSIWAQLPDSGHAAARRSVTSR